MAPAYTLEQFCSDKLLPKDWVSETFGVRESEDTQVHKSDGQWWKKGDPFILKGVFFAYSDGNGTLQHRIRVSKNSNKRFLWASDYKRRLLYGLNVPFKDDGKTIILVEGESDVITGRMLGLNTLGVAGAPNGWEDGFRTLPVFRDVERIYFVQEPKRPDLKPDDIDAGAELLRRVAESFPGKVYSIRLDKIQQGVKDLSDLWIEANKRNFFLPEEEFAELWNQAIVDAREFAGTLQKKKSTMPVVDEPDIKDENEALPEFPQLPGALGQLVDGITHDLPYDHKALAVITYIGIALAGKVSLAPDHWLQPRFYSCLVAGPNVGKSASDVEVRRELSNHHVLRDVCVKPSMDSGPGLVQALYDNRRLILAPDEIADQFEKARAGATGRNSLFGEILRLYESNETGNHTTVKNRKYKGTPDGGGSIEVHDALFAIIGGTTTQRFEQMFHGTGAVASGLQSRFVLAYSEHVIPRNKTPNDDEAIAAACSELRSVVAMEDRLEHLEQPGARRFRLSEAAVNAFMDWRRFENDGADKMKRILDMAKRFSLVVAACQHASEINGATMVLALQFADYQIALREKLFPMDAATYVQAFENRIIAFFEKHERATESVLQNNIKPERLQGGYSAYNRAWAELLRARRFQVVGVTRNNTPVYGPNLGTACS